MVGDFNLTPWSPRFRRLVDHGLVDESDRLVDAGLGFGVRPTWHVLPGFLGGLRIDQVLVNRHVRPLSHKITRAVGSDHRGVLVDFLLLP
jgi:endonuclease/exonuclease/phosphatase (EEP) superfamily protein YafD